MSTKSFALRLFHVTLTSFVLLMSPLNAQGDDTGTHLKTLARHGIKADATGISSLLKKVANADASADRVSQLINQLGNEDFQNREAAMLALRNMPVFPFQALQRATESDDAEIAFRAQALLKGAKQTGPNEMLVAAIEIIRERKIAGLVKPLLDAIPNLETKLHDPAIEAIRVSANADDFDALRSALAAERPIVRRAGIAGLSRFTDEGSLEWLKPLMKDKDMLVRLDAARTCLNGGERSALQVFVDLLSDDDISSRAKAATILRAASGKRFEFIAYDTDEKRKVATDKWKQWLATDGMTAKLNIPVPSHPSFVGRIIVAGYTQGSIVELDLQGKLIREFRIPGVNYPWGAQRLANGNTMITWYTNKYVAEYDGDNKEVWRYNTDGSYPWKALRLDNGNTLVTLGSKAVEVDRKGKEVWSHLFTAGSLTDLNRLPNGNTLALTTNTAVEIDREGRTIWEVQGISNGYRIQRLPNGNTLVAEKGQNRLVEFDRNKQRVWTFTKVPTPDCAQRLPDGRLLVSGGGGVHLFSKTGELIWKYPLNGQSVARFY